MIEALRFCCAVQGTPCGRLLAAALPDLVTRLRRCKEHRTDAGTAAQLLKSAPAIIDRWRKADRAKLEPRGRSHTKTWNAAEELNPDMDLAEWNDAVPAFVEIDLIGYQGSNNQGTFGLTGTALAFVDSGS